MSGRPYRAAQHRIGRCENLLVAEPGARPSQQRGGLLEPQRLVLEEPRQLFSGGGIESAQTQVLADALLMLRDRLPPVGVGVDRLGVGAKLQGPEPQDLPGYRPDSCGNTLQGGPAGRVVELGRLEFYSFVADNYAPFYSRPIECTDRDAPFVLDGVLYHESDLDLEEHYTDTHGYTEINFAAFGMVGMRFCPRIRSLHRQRIYCADPDRDHGVLEPVLKRGRRAVNFRVIAEQWDRIGQFYAAFPAGHATASAALQRLNRFQASNRFYAANRELGRALKTEFVLQYMSEPQLRAKVRRGLLKVEQLHALARAVYYGQRGPISAREVYDQVNACSCLTLTAAPNFPFDPDLLRHVSPIEVEERRPLRRDQDRPRQAQDATPLACITARMVSVP